MFLSFFLPPFPLSLKENKVFFKNVKKLFILEQSNYDTALFFFNKTVKLPSKCQNSLNALNSRKNSNNEF